MEPIETKVNYVVVTNVLKVEERFSKLYLRGVGDTAEFIESSLGWFVLFDGSWEALYMGSEQPQFKRRDRVKITFERIDDAQPSQPPVE